MKTPILEQIKNIQSDATLNVRQKHVAILAIEIDGKRGAPEAREIQIAIKDKIKKVQRDIFYKCLSNRSYKSHDQRLSERVNRESRSQLDQQSLIEQAAMGYPDLCLERSTSITPLKTLKGGCSSYRVRLGDWIISSVENVSYDNNCYSKSWHRKYGGKKSVDSRIVQIRKWTPTGIINKDVKVNSWAGNWLINGLINAGLVSSIKLQNTLKAVQLNTAFNVRLIRTILSVSLYERTLAGCHYDYCAVAAGNVTFHGSSIRECLKGLHRKTTDIQVSKNSPINFDFCKLLGFCDTGIKEFCFDFGLDLKGNYSPEKINEIVKTDLNKAQKYEQELRKVAKTLNYSFSI